MADVIKIKKGLTINLQGKAEKIFVKADKADFFAVKPTDFHLLTPKLVVNVDDNVKAGSILFYDKYRPEVKFTSPVSGKVHAINRGERRRILEVVIKADDTIEYENFKKADPSSLSRDEVIENLLQSGLWPFIKQRPYNIIANPEATPKAIFISAFDTSPLAPDYDFLLKGSENEFQTGINTLIKLSGGKVHLDINDEYPQSPVFKNIQGAQINAFRGPHPTGNVGIQIHHIDPINKGEVVWTVSPQDVITIGRLFLNGQYDASKIVVLAGSEVMKPKYYKTINGTSIEVLVKNNVKEGTVRHISGNVLTGTKIPANGFLGFYDSQVSVIPEGNHYEFLGWAMPGFKKFSYSHSFFSWLTPNRSYRLDTNLHGGHRSLMITGKYERVLPMDILPMQLLKAILVEDIDLMEKLGIYEVTEEDFALCEFIDTSKTDIQAIIRKGLDLMLKEMS